VLEIPDCAVHHPSINRAVHALVEATEKLGIAAYQETTRDYGLRYVQFQVERVTEKICLTLIWNAETLKQTQPALSRLIKELEAKELDLWHSFWCHCNDSTGNNIFSRNPRRWHRISGPEFIREPIPATDQGWLYFSPLTFRQGNLDGFDIIAEDVARAIPGGSKVCELYAGVGLLGLTALSYHANEENGSTPLPWIRCSDENPSNSRCFYRAVDSLPLHVSGRGVGQMQDDSDEKFLTLAELATMVESGNTPSVSQRSRPEEPSYLVASAGQALKAGQALGAQVLIVDPPRKGLEAEVLDELCKPFNPNQPYVEKSTFLTMFDDKVNWVNDVETLIYVSCGFDALARDCERLLSSPAGWVLQSATGYVLFPGSDHVETLAIFKRR
jgi:tRNA/tmRNA/rRNA uracil-C5-methylase (TrmA/RlmC/RlmD family)